MKYLCIIVLLFVLFGCKHGDFKAEVVIKGQPAPFDGYNAGPELYVMQGQLCPVSGVVIWIKGIDPNDIVGND